MVDDEPSMRRILVSNLRQEQHELVEANGVGDARRLLAECRFDAVITDQKMGDGEGLEVLAAVHENDPAFSVVFLTAFATIELAVESMRRGAFDFVTKPFVTEALLASAARAVEHTLLLRENERLRDTVLRLEGSSEITGRSAAIRRLREQIARVAPTNATVLIAGETGTGKELVARAIHHSSPRSSKPFRPSRAGRRPIPPRRSRRAPRVRRDRSRPPSYGVRECPAPPRRRRAGEVVFLRQRHPGTLVVGRAHQQDRETSRCIGTIHVGAQAHAVARAHHLVLFDHDLEIRFTLMRVCHRCRSATRAVALFHD